MQEEALDPLADSRRYVQDNWRQASRPLVLEGVESHPREKLWEGLRKWCANRWGSEENGPEIQRRRLAQLKAKAEREARAAREEGERLRGAGGGAADRKVPRQTYDKHVCMHACIEMVRVYVYVYLSMYVDMYVL